MSAPNTLPESCPHCSGEMPRWQNKSGLCSAKCAKERRDMWAKCGICLLSIGFTAAKAAKTLHRKQYELGRFLSDNQLSAKEIGKELRKSIRDQSSSDKATIRQKQARATRKEITGLATTDREREWVKQRHERLKYDDVYQSKRRALQRSRRKLIQENNLQSPEQKIKQSLYRRMRKFVHRGWRQGFAEICGCSQSELRKHIESQFTEGMSWGNYGVHGWHIDHIMPCSAFDFTIEYQIKTCFNWKNLRPLWAKENIAKSNRIMEPQAWLPLSA